MKKTCGILAVLALCIVIFATFVACNNAKEEDIVLTSDMTADQIRVALKDVKNFTMVVKNGTEIRYIQKWFENGYSETETNNGGNCAFFVENNRQYEFYWDDGTVEKRVIDCSGYDTFKTNYCETYLDICLGLLDEGYIIEDGQLILGGGAYIAKDFNRSKIDLPTEYKYYKMLNVNSSGLEYSDISDTECKLSAINVALNTLTVPQEYNGKTVVELNDADMVWTQLSIPITVKKLGHIFISSNSQARTIVYAGTKDQWARIEKPESEWKPSDVLIIQCSDGTIENNGGNTTPPTPIDTTANVKNYFNTLWEKSTGIGGITIGSNDDLKVSLGLTVALDFADGNGSVKDSIDLGILLDVVLDRSSGTDKSTNTAIKAKFYDPTSGENWFSAYYFFNDVDNLYIDYAGQHVQIPFEYLNDTYNKNFYNFVFNDKIIEDEVDKNTGEVTKQGKTLAQIFIALTQNMGSGWDLNTIINDILKLFDVDTISLKDTIGSVLEILGISTYDAFDAQGNINVKNILTNDTIASFFVNDETTTTTENGVTTYVTKLDPSVLDMLSMVESSLPESLKGLLDVIEGLDLALEFTTKNDAIDSFTIRAGLPAIEGENANAVDVHPVVAITITDLKFAKAGKAEIENSMATAKSNYTKDVVLDAEVAIDLKGITLNTLAFDKGGYARFSKVNTAIGGGLDNIVLDGTLALTLNGKIDLINNEGTAAKAALTYKGVNIVEASFVNGTLAVKVNQDAKIGELPIVDTLVRLFGDYVYIWVRDTFFKDAPEGADMAEIAAAEAKKAELDKFAEEFFSCNIKEQVAVNEKGEYIIDLQDRVITINKNFQGAAWKGIDVVGELQKQIKNLMDKLFPPKTDDNASASVATDPFLIKVADTVAAVLPLIKSTDGKLVVATNDNKAFKGNYATVGSAVTTIGKIWWVKNAKAFTDTLIENDKDGWLPVFANALKVAGTTYGDKADAEKIKTFLNEMFACTAELTLNISESNGAEFGIIAKVANANVAVSAKLGAKAFNASDYTDLAPADATTGWFVFDFSTKA